MASLPCSAATPPPQACLAYHRQRVLPAYTCRLSKVQRVAGSGAPQQVLLDGLVSGDFDPEEYDRQMAAAFGDKYYEVGGTGLGGAGL